MNDDRPACGFCGKPRKRNVEPMGDSERFWDTCGDTKCNEAHAALYDRKTTTDDEFARKEAIAYAELIKSRRTAPLPVLMVASLLEKAFLAGWDARTRRKS